MTNFCRQGGGNTSSIFCTKRGWNEREKSLVIILIKATIHAFHHPLLVARASVSTRVAINKGREEEKFNSQLTAGRPLTSRARPTFVIRGRRRRRRRRRPSSATTPAAPRTTAASGRIIALKGPLGEKRRQRETHYASITMSFSRGRLIIARC